APEDEAGGHSRFAGGVMRFAFDGVDDLRKVADLTDEEIAGADFGTYTRAQYFDDLFRLTQYRTDPTLVELLVTRSLDTMIWLRGQGARFVPIYGRQAGKVGGRWKFFGGLPIEASGGGAGLVQSLTAAACRRDVEILYETRALSLLWDGVRVNGVRVRSGGKLRDLTARAVVLACGGFEATAEWRTRYLGPGWELAKVRGTRFNTGEGLRMALEIGASPFGNWSGAHACGWDRNAPEFGELAIGDQFEKHSYPLGLLVNADGKRSVHEGRPRHRRPRAREVELGQRDRTATLRGVRDDVRDHLHLRRSSRRRGRPGARSRCGQDPGALRRGRDGGRDLLLQLSERRW